MADFAAVLRKTIGALKDNTPATRAKAYEKARATIDAKLAAVSPPPSPQLVERQKRLLEDAITAVEAEYALPAVAAKVRTDPLEDILADLDSNDIADGVDLDPPSAPPVKSGPKFQLVGGKLSSAISTPLGSEIALQRALHDQLRKVVHSAVAHTASMANRFPELVTTIQEYASHVDTETEGLDVSVYGPSVALCTRSLQHTENRILPAHYLSRWSPL